MVDQPSRGLRADAERNRLAIISSAEKVLAAEGTGVTLERIAIAANVGVGTIYRRFSSVEELVTIVFEQKMTQYAERSEAAAALSLDHPREAFDSYVRYILEEQAADLAFSDVILNPERGTDVFRAQLARAHTASHTLVDRARQAKAIRPDFDHTDLYLLIVANAGLIRGTRHSAPEAWRRFGDLMLLAFHSEDGRPSTAWQR